MIKAIIFDFDGLILDTEGPEYTVWAEAYLAHGCELTLAKWGEALGTGDHFDPHDHLEELAGRSLDRTSLTDVRRARYAQLMNDQTILPGVIDYLHDAGRLGLKLAVASSSTHDWVEGHLRTRALHHHFHAFRCRGDVPKTKPDPGLYLAAVQALEVLPGEAIALEDSPNGIRAAKAAGLFCVAVPNPLTRQFKLDEADILLDSLAQLSLEELLAIVEERS